MRNLLSKLLGLLLLVIALAGILMCLGGISLTWKYKSVILKEGSSDLDLLISTLDNTTQAISLVDDTLNTGINSLSIVDNTVEMSTSTLQSSMHFFDTAAGLTGKTLPDTLTSTRQAIQSASESAKLIDNTLSVIAAIPLIGSNYKPDVPLSTGLSNISESLANLPDTFRGMQDDMLEIKGDMSEFENHLGEIHNQITQVNDSLKKSQDVVVKYQTVIGELKPKLSALREKLPRIINVAAVALTIFLAWIALAQLGTIVQAATLILTPGGFGGGASHTIQPHASAIEKQAGRENKP